MEDYFYNEPCPKCREYTLNICKSLYHHVETCSNEHCDYKCEEYKPGFEDFLYKKSK